MRPETIAFLMKKDHKERTLKVVKLVRDIKANEEFISKLTTDLADPAIDFGNTFQLLKLISKYRENLDRLRREYEQYVF